FELGGELRHERPCRGQPRRDQPGGIADEFVRGHPARVEIERLLNAPLEGAQTERKVLRRTVRGPCQKALPVAMFGLLASGTNQHLEHASNVATSVAQKSAGSDGGGEGGGRRVEVETAVFVGLFEHL